MSSAALMLGTSNCRDPSRPATSMARPRLTCSGVTTPGFPSTVVKERFISGIARSARTTAKPMRWVKETFPPRPRARWLLITIRLSDSSLAGHGPHAGRRGNAEAGRHVLGRARGGTAQPHRGGVVRRSRAGWLPGRLTVRRGLGRAGRRGGRPGWGGRRRRCGRRGRCRSGVPGHGVRRCGWRRRGWCRCGWCRCGPGGMHRGGGRRCRAPRGRPVVCEEVPPLHGHRRGIGQVALVQLIDEPFVRPEIRAGVASLRFLTGKLGRVLGWSRGRPRRLRRHCGHRLFRRVTGGVAAPIRACPRLPGAAASPAG